MHTINWQSIVNFFTVDVILILSFLVLLFMVLSIITALMETRTPQGSVAWILSLFYFPLIAIPVYWIFGRSRFKGYIESYDVYPKAILDQKKQEIRRYLEDNGQKLSVFLHKGSLPDADFFSHFLSGNKTELLLNGDEAYGAMFEAMKKAQKYILVQFYIVRNDATNEEMKKILIAKAKEGVRVYYTYDPVGSEKMKEFTRELQASGVVVSPFVTTNGFGNRFQINFRNHRKMVVVDGNIGFTGGLNVGDEYRGLVESYGFYRDTNISIVGAAVILLQFSFLQDWRFMTGKTLEDMNWTPEIDKEANDEIALIPTSPASKHEYGTLFFLHLINSAKKRIWIANPYFVPDEQFVSALQLAAMRGVEIKIVMPRKNNHFLIQHSMYSYLNDFRHFDTIELFYYTKGFMHQKVMLIDDDLSVVGTHNFDNRSFRLNFEISALVRSQTFNQKVEAMLRDDMAHTKHISKDTYLEFPFYKKIAVRFSRLFTPIL